MVGFDGSLAAGAAIDATATLLPHASAQILHLWTPPFTDETVRRRLWQGEHGMDGFVAAIEREGAALAGRIAATGVALAESAGWTAQPVAERCDGGHGLYLGELAGKLDVDLVLVGSRGLAGATAVLGSVSDMIVHYAPRPVLVVPYPLLTAQRQALPDGPIVLAWDGSDGAQGALAAVERLFAGRSTVLVWVSDGADQPSAPSAYELTVVHRDGSRVTGGRSVSAALLAAADRHRAAVVAVGSRGRSAIPEILLGSVAMATLHRASVPVLVMPHAAQLRQADSAVR
jgi:nucleotide-binding universal stress UspA family protein